VFKFHLIQCPIAQESNLERKGRNLGEKRVSRDFLIDNVRPYPDNVRFDPDNVRLTVHISKDLPADNVHLTVLAQRSFTVMAVFC
jgi:hypothetical protein